MPRQVVGWWDAHQVPLLLAAIALGAAVGVGRPQLGPVLDPGIQPALMALLFATFLGVPLVEVGRALRDARFLGSVTVANFVVVPLVAGGLSRFVADEPGLLLGVLLVLLTPCVDYVIVFTGLAGGARDRLVAAVPLLMALQVLLLPLYLLVLAGPEVLSVVEVAPFVEAFLLLIVVPLAAAALVQSLSRRHRAGRLVEEAMAAAMVPLLMATLALVVGSQVARLGPQAAEIARVVPIYVAFVVVAVAVGMAVGRAARLDVPSTRAVVFSTATRNSLVVLPLALALPASLAIVPLVVVTQTLVELVAMVVLVRLVPALTGGSTDRTTTAPAADDGD
ncbi:arsenic resistance protein [uncultured Serinicoccus sp.]|uniref:arsenic resistance protein n=1 Tax=uncultured Serinicoccus sp. TaxID=735514 RepID=UPI0026250F98|nr:arsenic resistance protein [uncultured Serinicoccus sp.]